MSVKNVLLSLGYKPRETNGNYSCSAIYRDGDNPTALSVHAKTGVFFDFVTKNRGSLKTLIEITTGAEVKDFEDYLEKFDIDILELEEDKPKIMSEKIWDESELDTVFPHYKFYEERGISKETLRFFKSGMQHSGTMNRRYVFPIYNRDGKIHGWTGRDMTNKRDIKWYHTGSTRNWIYPLFMSDNGRFPTAEAIRESGQVILVESVGDMMALWEKGFKNVLVTFGVSLSTKVCSCLMGLGAKKIIISTNNDFDKKNNVGAKAAVDIFIKLLSYVDREKLVISLPYRAGDFGEISEENFEVWKKRVESPNMAAINKAVVERCRELLEDDKLSKRMKKVLDSIIEDE